VTIKNAYDPMNLFRLNSNIPPTLESPPPAACGVGVGAPVGKFHPRSCFN
jgi:hypothetical protein